MSLNESIWQTYQRVFSALTRRAEICDIISLNTNQLKMVNNRNPLFPNKEA